MKKKDYRNYNDSYDDEAVDRRNKKKIMEDRQRKAQRNMKNAFRSKNFDVNRYEQFED